MADTQPASGFQLLDDGVALQVLGCLSPRQVCAAASTCKLFARLANQPALWRHFYEQQLQQLHGLLSDAEVSARQAAASTSPSSPASPTQAVDWKRLVRRGLSVRDMRTASWEAVQLGGSNAAAARHQVRPCAREGHAASSWGPGGCDLILFGGWGSGIRNDLFILDRQEDAFQWRSVSARGQRPVIRYGHTATCCGPNWDMLVVYGGMQSGGYHGEIEELAVLRPYTPLASTAQQPAQTTSTTSTTPDAITSATNAAPGSRAGGGGAAAAEWEWMEPELKGARPQPRGYHAACASPDGRLVYLFGGMADHDCCNTLAVVNVETWECEVPATQGTPPVPRFGCSLVAWAGGLWVVGGGHGNDLARSGYDMQDVWRLDLGTMTWAQVQLRKPLDDPKVLGRCHASCLVGSKLVMFGGSLDLGNTVTWLDLDSLTWGTPTILGSPPAARMSAVMTLSGTDILLFGGWIYSRGEMGDLYRLKLDPPESERQEMRHIVKAQVSVSEALRAGLAGQVAGMGCNISAAAAAAAGSSRGHSQGCRQAHMAPTLACKRTRGSSSAAARNGAPGSGSGSGSGCGLNSREVQRSGSSSSTAGRAGVVPTDEEEQAGKGCLPRGVLREMCGLRRSSTSSDDEGSNAAVISGYNSAGALDAHMSRYFALVRQVQAARVEDQEGEVQGVPQSVLHELRHSMDLVRLLRAEMYTATWGELGSSEEEEEGAGEGSDDEYNAEEEEEQEESDEDDEDGSKEHDDHGGEHTSEEEDAAAGAVAAADDAEKVVGGEAGEVNGGED